MIFRKAKDEPKTKLKDKKESRLKINRDEEVTEGEIVEREWDIKKIVIGVIVLIFLIIVGSYIFFPPSTGNSEQALGVSTENLSPTPPLPKAEDVQGIIQNAQNTLSQITAQNVTSSDSAIQKVIDDLEMLKGKNGALNVVCNMMCKK